MGRELAFYSLCLLFPGIRVYPVQSVLIRVLFFALSRPHLKPDSQPQIGLMPASISLRHAFSGTQINAEKHRFSWVFGAKRYESGQISVNLR